jgi:hypothetical protein
VPHVHELPEKLLAVDEGLVLRPVLPGELTERLAYLDDEREEVVL